MTGNYSEPDSGDAIGPNTKLNVQIKSSQAPISMRIVTYNVRYATEWLDQNEKPWHIRAPKLTTQLEFITAGHENAFLCLQECLYSQVKDIQNGLGPGWAHVGRGRESKETEGEYSPIFYQPSLWKCTTWETKWLSETPHKPSRGWDAALNRIVTIGLFTHRATTAKVVVMATHFDHAGVVARKHSAELLLQFANEWRKQHDPICLFIGGDFNSPPGDGAYQVMVAPGSNMSDVHDLVDPSKRYGNEVTYTGFSGSDPDKDTKLDFLFVQEPRTVKVKTFGVLSNIFDDQIRISDHRPVVADFMVPI